MRYSPDHKRETRERVLHAAARAMRRMGPSKVAVGDVMRDAGLTHGGFYAHFSSKDDLIVHAIDHMFCEALANFGKVTGGKEPQDALRDYVCFYLSRSHWAQRDAGCPLAALACDAPRLHDDAREAFKRGATQLTDSISGCLAAMGHRQPDQMAVSVLSELVGALSVARATADEVRARQVLEGSRSQLLSRLQLT